MLLYTNVFSEYEASQVSSTNMIELVCLIILAGFSGMSLDQIL